MSLIELKDIGKIYVSENSVAVGIRGVNAKMDIGEFIAVTGASGSGKTTLLNVLSGMDTYEEGEMLVCGEPTSHYIQSDWEEYREKYISFIFQDYNILESFTVLQNVELALTHIKSKKERRKRAEYLIDKVGLTKHKNHKGSKLSGGQKQRTVIARALAKDSPVILADEPTGNLDSKSSEEIIALLKEISAEKLVVVVTHSFDEVKDVATREIRIFDGSVERDTEIRSAGSRAPAPVTLNTATEGKSQFSFIREGIELGAHRFFAKPKLASFMSIIMIIAIIATFFITAMFFEGIEEGMNDYIFTPLDGRVVVTRVDGAVIKEEEIKSLAERFGAESYLSFDHLLDSSVYIQRPDREYGYLGVKYAYGTEDCKPSVGRLPNKGEVFLRLPIGMQPYFGKDTLLINTVTSNHGEKYTVSGVQYYYDNGISPEMAIRVDDFTEITSGAFFSNSNSDINISYYVTYSDGSLQNHYENSIVVNKELSGNEILIVGKYSDMEMTSIGDFTFSYYSYNYMKDTSTYEFEVNYNAEKSDKLWNDYMNGKLSYNYNVWGIHISPELASELIENTAAKTNPQGSLFFENDKRAKEVCEELEKEGYFALTTDVYYFDISEKFFAIVLMIFTFIIWFSAITFLCFFLSLCMSRNVDTLKKDVGILRSMGIKNNAIKVSMYAIMTIAMIPALIFFAVTAVVVYTSPYLNPFVPFIHAPHYVAIVLGMVIIIMRLAGRNNKRIFNQSVRKTLRGGNAE